MKEVTQFFDGVKMSSDCVCRISRALETGRYTQKEGYTVMKRPTAGTALGAVAAALVCLVLITAAGWQVLKGEPNTEATTPTVMSKEQLEEKVQENELRRLQEKLEELQEAYGENGAELPKTVDIQDWLTVEDSELYFCQEEDRIHWEAITNKISPEEPYTYNCVREDGTVLFLAIGGTFDSLKGLKSIGWYSGIWDGENWIVQGEGYEGQRWFLEKVGALMDQAPVEAMRKAVAKEDFENGLRYTEGNITYTYGRDASRTEYDTSLHTPFTVVEDGRVYFIANGEKVDITGRFSEEEPFTYIFTDSHLLTHYIAIGGTPENPCYLEMIRKSWEIGMAAGCGGTGVNTWNSETDERYGWETRAKEIFEPYGVYWVS